MRKNMKKIVSACLIAVMFFSLFSYAKTSKEQISDAKKEAESQRQEALEEVKKELALKRQEALKDLEKEKDKARKELYDEVVNLALDASKELLNREVDSEDNKKLVASFIDNLESEK